MKHRHLYDITTRASRAAATLRQAARRVPLAPVFAALLLLAGCATKQQKTGKTFYFFPPPPDQPRLQFLTSFSSEKGFGGGNNNTFLNYLTGEATPDKAIGKPYGGVARDKKIYLCDTDLGAVLVADFQSRRLRVLAAQGEGALKVPLNLALDTDGTFYIADSGREQVVILDAKENFIAALGQVGEMKPRDVALTKDRIYVADMQGHCVRVYNKASRALQSSIPSAEDCTNELQRILMPTNLAVDGSGRLYVADTGGFHVQVYDAQGHYLHTVGEFGQALGQFARLKGIAVDRDNRLYAVDTMHQVVQVFDDQGRLLTWFGAPPTGGDMKDLPSKVLVDYEDVGLFQQYAAPNFKVEHLVIVINQIGPRKVSVFGFGQKH